MIHRYQYRSMSKTDDGLSSAIDWVYFIIYYRLIMYTSYSYVAVANVVVAVSVAAYVVKVAPES